MKILFGFECVVFWCIIVPLYSLLSGYIKHQLKKQRGLVMKDVLLLLLLLFVTVL